MISAILKSLAVLAAVAALALWIDHRSETVLPTPSGPYPVGRSIQDWSAQPATRAGVVNGAKNSPESDRELLAWIWYPAVAPSSLPDDYLPAYVRAAYQRND